MLAIVNLMWFALLCQITYGYIDTYLDYLLLRIYSFVKSQDPSAASDQVEVSNFSELDVLKGNYKIPYYLLPFMRRIDHRCANVLLLQG